MNKGLLKRIKKLEKTIAVEGYSFVFEDGSGFEITAKQFHQIWDDISEGKPNQYYDALKAKLEDGFPDDGGLIYLMKAHDPNEIAELWDSYEELET